MLLSFSTKKRSFSLYVKTRLSQLSTIRPTREGFRRKLPLIGKSSSKSTVGYAKSASLPGSHDRARAGKSDTTAFGRLNEVAGAADAISGQTLTTRERLRQAAPMLDKQRQQHRIFPDGLIWIERVLEHLKESSLLKPDSTSDLAKGLSGLK